MADESDGIEEAFDGQLRIAVTAAGRIGEALARAREDAARRAQAQSEQEARELSSRFEAEKRAARVELGSVYRSDWWDRATPEQIGGALTTARAWGSEDPEAVRAEGRIRDELRTRYGVDVNNTGADNDAATVWPTSTLRSSTTPSTGETIAALARSLSAIERLALAVSLLALATASTAVARSLAAFAVSNASRVMTPRSSSVVARSSADLLSARPTSAWRTSACRAVP